MERTLNEWDEPSKFPTLAYILRRIEADMVRRAEEDRVRKLWAVPPVDFDPEERKREFAEMIHKANLAFPSDKREMTAAEYEARMELLRQQAEKILA